MRRVTRAFLSTRQHRTFVALRLSSSDTGASKGTNADLPEDARSAEEAPSASLSSSPLTSTDAVKAVQAQKGFCSTTKFKYSPSQVTETNVPSAREVASMIPTFRELQQQLPDARELESKYIQSGHLDTTVPAEGAQDLSSSEAGAKDEGSRPTETTLTRGIFQKTTDPIEDLLFGPPKDDKAAAASPLRPQHLLLAYKALMWGTLYALIGFLTTVLLAMVVCGYRSVDDLLQAVRSKVDRDAALLASAEGDDVVLYVIDIRDPVEAWRQAQRIWATIQQTAEEKDAEKTVAPPSGSN